MGVLLLDTNVVSYFMKGHTFAASYRPLVAGHTLAISFMTLAELYDGALSAGWSPTRWEVLGNAVRQYLTIPSSEEACQQWARVRQARRERPLSSEDTWIAAVALAHGLPLVTHDAENFAGIPGLTIVTAPT